MDPLEFAKQLDRIALHNRDDFGYRFDLLSRRNRWELTVYETTDQHTFIHCFGATPEAACAEARERVDAALQHWNYSQPEDA